MRNRLAKILTATIGFTVIVGANLSLAAPAQASSLPALSIETAQPIPAIDPTVQEYTAVYTSNSLTVPAGDCFYGYCLPEPYNPGGGVAPSPAKTDPPPYVESTDEYVKSGVDRSYVAAEGTWRLYTAGFMGFAGAPTFNRVETDTGVIYAYSRETHNAPPNGVALGACQQGQHATYNYSGPASSLPSVTCVNDGDYGIEQTNCALATDTGNLFDPMTNYSFGSAWRWYQEQHDIINVGHYVDVQHWVDKDENGNVVRTWTESVNARGSWEEFSGNREDHAQRVEWGACEFHGSPYEIEQACMIDVSYATFEGPYANTLPARNGYRESDTIPETENQTSNPIAKTVLTGFGEKIYQHGLKLLGYGPGPSATWATNCHEPEWGQVYAKDFSWADKKTVMTVPGIYTSVVDSLQTLCHVIRYPGYNEDSFRGCDTPVSVRTTQYFVANCSAAIAGSPGEYNVGYAIIQNNELDNWKNYKFDPSFDCLPDDDPAWLECPNTELLTITTEQDDGTETNLPVNVHNNTNLYSVVESDGRPITIEAPLLNRPFASIGTYRNIRQQWTVWEVDPGSSPWAWDSGENANANDQPFAGRVAGDEALVVVDDNISMLPKDAFPNTPSWARPSRTLNLSFFRPGNDGEGMFSVRGHFSEQVDITLQPKTVVAYDVNGPIMGSAPDEIITIAPTCDIPWQTFKVVGGRNTSGNTLGR